MTIKKIEIKGYRSLRHVVWEPGALNLVIGPNGSGKSNLLQALDLLGQSANGNLAKSIIGQGGLRSILWDQTEPQLKWEITTIDTLVEFNYLLSVKPFGVDADSRWNSNYHIVAEKLIKHEQDKPDGEAIVLFEFEHGKARQYSVEDDMYIVLDKFNPNDAEPLYAQVNSDRALYSPGLSFFHIYHNLRVEYGAPLRSSVVTRHSPWLDWDGGNLVSFLHTNYTKDREFREGMNDAMRAAFPDFDQFEFAPEEDNKIQLRIAWKSLRYSQSAAVLSDGTLRFMWLSSLLLHSGGRLIAVDEPETGLHPRMFSILAELARDAAEGTQVIFTTHSSEFLDAFSKSAPTITVTNCEKGETQLSVVDKDDLSRWLKEYSPGALFRSGELEALA